MRWGETKAQSPVPRYSANWFTNTYRWFCCGHGSAMKGSGAAHFLKIATMQKPRVFKCHEDHKISTMSIFLEDTASFKSC